MSFTAEAMRSVVTEHVRETVRQSPGETVKAPNPSETAVHRAVADYLRTCLAGSAIGWANVNERAGAGQRLAAVRAGMLCGLPDISIADGGTVIFIELKPAGFRKKRTFNRHEQRQFEVHRRLRLAGCTVEICETLGEVVWLLQRLGVPLRGSDVEPTPIPPDEAMRARFGVMPVPQRRVARDRGERLFQEQGE